MPTTRQPTEADLLRACLDWLRCKGVFAWRSGNSGIRRTDKKGRGFWSFNGMKGVSDIVGCLTVKIPGQGCLPGQVYGLLLAIEVKGPKGRLSPEQAAFLEEVRRRGGVSLCVRSLKDLEEGLKGLV